jgi:DNA repair protein radc
MYAELTRMPILAWAEEDRPREKMLLKGHRSLSDAELIAILLGSGSKGESAVALAQSILASVDNDLRELGKRSLAELQKFKGVGEAKSIAIAAALELGRRRQLSDLRERPKITSSRDAYLLIAPMLADLHHEEFWVLMLNKSCEVIKRENLSIGGTSGTVVDVKKVLKAAIDAKASAFIAIHNHPSGGLNPSDSDLRLTKRMVEAGKLIDMPMMDHLIVSERGYYSFADEGMI